MLSKDLPATIGRYEVVQEIGRGGMGVVFLGRDPRIGRQVAIKLLDTSEEGVAERFLQEARSAGQLKHPNIITIHDFGEVDDGSERDGLPFIIMEFIEGTSLAGLISRNDASLSVARKLALIEDLAAGLDYAHNKGVVHRDVKPANVMIDRDGVLKILDFGIARVGGSSLTVNGSMMGTPSYMSPEQAQGRPVDRRSDVFAVGLVLYELLSGRRAFTGTFTKVLYAIVSEDPPSLDSLCPNLDSGLVSIVNKAIQKDEQHRYQTLADLASDIALVRARIDTRPLDKPLDPTAIGTPRPSPERTPRHLTPREQFAHRRSENLEGYLDRARRAFEAGDFVAAIAAAEEAELLDPAEPRVIDVLTSARDRVDQQQIGSWLAEAERCVTRRELDHAGALVTKALHLDAGSPAALRMKSAIDSARREMEHDADAVAAVERARKRFAGGDPAGSLSQLDAFRPPHRLVTQAREELTAELLEQERLTRGREAQRRADAVDRALSAAAGHVSRHAWDDASRALVDAEAIDPQNVRLLALRDEIAAAREAAWARTKRVTRAVSAAAHSLAAADFDGAERFVDEALAIEPSHPEALALRSRTADMRAIAARAEEEQDSRTVLSEPGSASDAEVSAGLAVSPPPNRPRVRAAIGMTLAVVIPVLLLGFWWQGPRSPEQRVADTKVVVRGDETPTGTKPTDLSGSPDSVVGTSSRSATNEPATQVQGSTRSSTGVVQPPRPLPAQPPPTGTGATSAHESAANVVNISPPAGPEQPNGAPPAGPEPPSSARPTPEERVVPPPDPVTPRVPREPPPPSPQPVSPPTPVVVPSFDRGIADRILAEYVAAMRRLDLAAIKSIYPKPPNSLVARIEALKKDYSQCDLRFSSVEIPMSGPTEATVRVSGIESCKPKTRQPAFDLPIFYQFRLVKETTTGKWNVSELLTQ